MDKKNKSSFDYFNNAIKKNRSILIALSCVAIGLIAVFLSIQFSSALPSGTSKPSGWHKVTSHLSKKEDDDFYRLMQSKTFSDYTSFSGSWTSLERMDKDTSCKTRKIKLKKGTNTYNTSFVVPKGIKYLGKEYNLKITIKEIKSDVAYNSSADLDRNNTLAINCHSTKYPAFMMETEKDKHVEFKVQVDILDGSKLVKIPDLVIGLTDVDAYQSYKVPDKVTTKTAYAPQVSINYFNQAASATYIDPDNYLRLKSVADKAHSSDINDGRIYVDSPTASTGSYTMWFGFDERAGSAIDLLIHRWTVTYKAGTGANLTGEKTEKRMSGGSPSASEEIQNPSPKSGYGGSPIYNCTMGGKSVVTNGTKADVKAVKLTDDMTCTISYNPIYKVTYAVDGTGGSITGKTSENVAKNNSPTGTTEKANTGYQRTGWTCTQPSDRQGTTTVVGPNGTMAQIKALKITANTDCKVKYSPIPEDPKYTVTYASADNGGTVTGTTSEIVEKGKKPIADVTDTANDNFNTTDKWTCKDDNGDIIAGLSEVSISRIKLTEIYQNMSCIVPHTPKTPAPVNYRVTYAVDGTGGSITGKTSETVSSGDNPSGTTEKANNHYNIAGWKCTAEGTTVLPEGSSMSSLRNLVITANTDCLVKYNPDPKYTVTYESADNHGEVTGTTSESVWENEYPSGLVTDTPSEGYVTTNKWTCVNHETQNVIAGLSEVQLSIIKSTKVTQNMDCNVPHATDPVPVKYESENGTIPDSALHNETVMRGSKASGSTNVPNPGYSFKGWLNDVPVKINNEIKSPGTLLTDEEVRNSIITTATTFTAINIPMDYTITYETDNGGTITNSTTQDGKRIDTRQYGEKIESGANLKTKPGYTLTGWSCKDNNGSPVSTLQNTSMETIEAWTVIHDLYCKATHTSNKYTITYETDGKGTVPKALDDNGSPTNNNNELVEFGENPNGAVETPNSGYSTTHWSCNKNVTLKDGTDVTANSNITMANIKNIVMDKDLTCTVYHAKNNYIVTYNNTDGHGSVTGVNGGGEGSSTESVKYDGNPSGASYSPNLGYKYEKWTVDKNVTLIDGTTVSSGSPISESDIKKVLVRENLTFTVWFEKEVLVTLNKYEMLEDGTRTQTTLEGAEFELHEGSSAGKCLGGPYTGKNECESHGLCKYTKEIDGEDCDVVVQKETAEGCELEVEADYGKNMVYTPYKWEDSSSRLIGEYTTDSNGQIKVSKITDSTGKTTNFEKGKEYYFLETKAPKSYTITNEVTSFVVGNEDIVLNVYNKRKLGEVKLVKTDKKGNRLEGAKFGLYKKGVTGDNSIEYTSSTVRANKSSAGIVIDGDKTFGNSSIKYLNNQFTSEKIEEALGKATISQVKSIISPYYTNDTDDINAIEIENYSADLYGILLISSISNDGTEIIGTLYLVNKSEPSSSTYGRVGTYTTNANGEINIDELTWADYYLKEISPPKGYQLNEERYEFTLDRETVNDTIELDAEDIEAKGRVLLTKEDENGDPLSGAKFNIYKNDGTLVKYNLTTDNNGQISVDGLPFGLYYFDEIEAPTGYGLSEEKGAFEISKDNINNLVKVTMTNSRNAKPYVRVIKKIKKSDIVYEHGEATFIYRLSGNDTYDIDHEYYKTVTFKQSVVDEQNTEYVTLTAIFKGLNPGIYTLNEEIVNRYTINQITDISSTGILEGDSVKFTLTSNSSNGEATFVNKKTKQSGLSHTDIIINSFKKGVNK